MIEKVICSKWNWRDCEDAKISGSTSKFVLFVDGAPGILRAEVELATKELAESLLKFVEGCKASWRVISSEQ